MTERLIRIQTQPRMGRAFIHHDERSKNFRATTLLKKSQDAPRDRFWRRGGAYDQGQSSTCVPHTGKGLMNTLPNSKKFDYRFRSKWDPYEWYPQIQRLDEWEGESPAYEGTSGLALMKFLLGQGHIKEFRACFSLEDYLLTLSHLGPIAFGTWWYTDMFYPDENGLVRATGGQEGGHEIELTGLDWGAREIEFTNTWGPNWGNKGRGRMSLETFDQLRQEGADGYMIVK